MANQPVPLLTAEVGKARLEVVVSDITTLAVHIEWAHTHITQNPVAVNTQCWPARRARAKIYADGRVEYGF